MVHYIHRKIYVNLIKMINAATKRATCSTLIDPSGLVKKLSKPSETGSGSSDGGSGEESSISVMNPGIVQLQLQKLISNMEWQVPFITILGIMIGRLMIF